MAGRGSRLRPHTLTVPKPLIPVAGKPIVHRLVTDIAKVLGEPIEEVAFILGDPAFFGDDVVESLMENWRTNWVPKGPFIDKINRLELGTPS